MFMVLNTTFNNTLVTSWRSVLLEETIVPGETTDCHKSLTNLSHNVVSSTPCREWDLTSQRLR